MCRSSGIPAVLLALSDPLQRGGAVVAGGNAPHVQVEILWVAEERLALRRALMAPLLGGLDQTLLHGPELCPARLPAQR